MANIPPPQDRFHATFLGLVKLVADLNTKCYNSGFQNVLPSIVNFGVAALGSFDKKVLIESFIDKTYSHWDKIRNREEEYFYEKAGEIFGLSQYDEISLPTFVGR